jgi:hypothetical protein
VKLLYTEYNTDSDARTVTQDQHTNRKISKIKRGAAQPLVGGVGHQLSELVPWPARVSLASLR